MEGILYLGMIYYLFNEFREVYAIYNATGSPVGYFYDLWSVCSPPHASSLCFLLTPPPHVHRLSAAYPLRRNVIDWLLISLSFYALYLRISFALLPAVRSFSPFSTSYQEVWSPSLFPSAIHQPSPRLRSSSLASHHLRSPPPHDRSTSRTSSIRSPR